MPSSKGIRAGRAFVELFAEDAELNRALMRAAGRLKAFGRAVRNIGLSVGGAGTAMLAPLIKGVQTYAQMSFELQRASAVTGMAAKSLSGMSYAVEKNGVDFQTLVLALGRYQRNLVNAVHGQKMACAAFDEVHVSVSSLAKMSPEDQFYAMADAFSKVESPAVRAHAALSLYGRGATRLLPVLQAGAGAIRGLVTEAKAMGRVFSESDIRLGASLYKTWVQLKGGITGLWYAIGRNLAPAVQFLADTVMPLIGRLNAWIKGNPVLFMGILAVGGALAGFGATLVAVGIGVQILGVVLAGLATVLGGVMAVIGAIVSPVGLLVVGFGALVALLVSSPAGIAGMRQALGFLGEKFKWLTDTARLTFGGIADALRAGDFNLAANIAWLGLQVAWKEGVLGLKEAWIDFKAWMRTGAQWDFFELGALALSGFCQLMIHAITGVAMAFAVLRRDMKETMALLKNPRGGGSFIEDMAAAEKEYADTKARLMASDAAAVGKSQEWRDKRFQEAEAARTAALAGDQARLAAERGGLDPLRARIAALKAELSALRKDASDELADTAIWEKIAEAWQSGPGGGPVAATARRMTSIGQFGAGSLDAMRASGEKQLLEDIADNTERGADAAEEMKMEFD